MLLYRQFNRLSCRISALLISRNLSQKIMNKIYFRHSEPSGVFEITFLFSDSAVNVNRKFNFKRNISETVNDFLSRVKTNVEKVVQNKSKRRKKGEINPEEDICEVEVFVKENGCVVDNNRICKEVFFSGDKNLTFHVSGQEYRIVINPPWVLSMSIPQSLMVGSFAYPCKLELIFGSKEKSEFIWLESDTSGGNWKEVATGSLLYVSEKFVGHKLKLICKPGNGEVIGPEFEAVSNAVVKPGPVDCPFSLRHNYTKESLPNESFRVVSYNILADVYAETVTAKTALFPYCPSYAMNIDYRKQLYIKEILGYNADIICLQEVDGRIFKNDLTQVLDDYEGVLTRKSGNSGEGVATFYAKRKFRLLEHKELPYGDEIDKNPIFSQIWEAIKNNEPVASKLKERSTVFHALILESGNNILVVGNTHLYFHPTADHIRLIQGGMAVKFMENIVLDFQKKGISLMAGKSQGIWFPDFCRHPVNSPTLYVPLAFIVGRFATEGRKTSLVFCGDMNSTPDCGLYLLMTEKKAPSDLPDWSSDKHEVVKGIELSQPFEMQSAYGAPQFTNYTVGFSGCLDYIYYQADVLKLLQTVPIPSEEVLKANTALPSPVFPSDHVALIADFSWIPSK